MTKSKGKGRGWRGHSAEHAKAGRKGGLARARNMRRQRGNGQDEMVNEDIF